MNYERLSTHPTHPAGFSDRSTAASRSAQGRTLESRPETEIFKAQWRAESLIRSCPDYDCLPWQRITDDAVFRTDLIIALFRLAKQNQPQHAPLLDSYGSGLDGSEGNSGQERGHLPDHLAPAPTLNGYESHLI